MVDEKEEMCIDGIPLSQYCLTPGKWDIQYKDKTSFNTCLMRYEIKEKTLLKKFEIDGLMITEIQRIR